MQTQVVLDGTGVLIQAVDAGVQEHHRHDGGHGPAQPADDLRPEDEDQNEGSDEDDDEEQDRRLPHQEIETAGPGRQKALDRTGHVRIDHIHQGGVLLTHLDQHPGEGTQDGCRQITTPILQGNIPLS